MIMGLSTVRDHRGVPCLRAIMPAGADLGRVLRAVGDERPEFDPTHPLGCHRRRVPDRVVFEHVVAALVHGSGYERIASPGCSDRTIRRRLKAWAALGIGEQVHALALRAYDQMIGLELADVAVDGCITKAPCGGERAGPSPVDRRKGGLKRSVATENYGIPLGIACRTREPARLPAAGPHLAGRQRASWAACCPRSAPATWTPATTAGRTRQTLERAGLRRPDRRQGHTRPRPGRHGAGRWSEPTPG